MRIGDCFKYNRKVVTSSRRRSVPLKSYMLCKAAGRMFNGHELIDCRYLLQSDKKALGWSRLVTNDVCEDDEVDLYDGDTPENVFSDPAVRLVERDPVSHQVGVVQSPVLYTFYRQHPIAITLDSGATINMILASTARACKLPITPIFQIARQADGVTPLDVIGEIHCNVTRGSLSFQFDALVVKQLDVDVLAGNPFLARNDVAVRPSKKQIIIGDADIIYYGTDECKADVPSVRRTQAFLLRNPRKTVILPGDYLELHTPCDVNTDTLWALEPRLDSRTNMQSKPERAWTPPQEILSTSGALHSDFDDVFDTKPSLYNGASGKIQAFVNMGPTLPPQRKGRLPQYNRSTLNELQDKFDELESGVIAKPEQVDVRVEYLNQSFLVRKHHGCNRLVTSFGTVAQYSKPQPSLMPSVDSVLRQIGK